MHHGDPATPANVYSLGMTDADATGMRARLVRMTGRDPGERHRAATPLELLFDLSFVVAFGVASSQFAHLLAIGHLGEGLLGFGFAMFSICWAWINFSWFASAYDTDDWLYRVTTMVQMVGVIVLALGLPTLFHSIEEGGHIDNGIMVIGYVIMRVALIVQWLRAANGDPQRRRVALAYVGFVAAAQVGWVALAVLHLDLVPTLVGASVLFLVELGGPVVAERVGPGTPWHPHHIAERYALLTIIALGEGVFGTVATVSAIIERQSWSVDAVVVIAAGIGLTFGLWWIYFMLPSGRLLALRPDRALRWGYGHILVFASIAAVGAGLHVAAYEIEGESTIGISGSVLAVAIPVALFIAVAFTIYSDLVGEVDPFHVWPVAGSITVLVVAVALSMAGVGLAICLLVITAAPAVVVVAYETVGWRHQTAALQRVTTR